MSLNNIALIGMSGSGKSTVGSYISQSIGYKYIDTDSLIVEREEMEIDNIFKLKGEEYFRRLEASILKEIIGYENIVISTGGGVILREDNILSLRKNSIVFYFKSNSDNIYKNLKGSKEVRPLLEKEKDLKLNIEKMYKLRKEKYENSADYIIDVVDKDIYQIGNEVIKLYNKKILR